MEKNEDQGTSTNFNSMNLCTPLSQPSNEVISCPRCPPDNQNKTYKGKRGLKIHYARLHKEFMSDLDDVHSDASSPETAHLQSLDSLVALLANLKRNVKVLKRIPKSARASVANLLSSVMDECRTNNSLQTWSKLLLFSYTALRVPEKSMNLVQAVKVNASPSNLVNVQTVTPKKKKKVTSLSDWVESKIAEGDVRGAVKILSLSDSLAEESPEVYDKLKQKHPSPRRNLSFPPPPDFGSAGLVLSEKQVLEGVFHFPNGSSGGIDGLRPQHLKDLLAKSNGEAADKFLTSLTKLSNFLVSGNVDTDIIQVLYGANICALEKKDGGIRPIAIGCTLRRLVSKVACRYYSDSVSSYLQPHQLGFGTKGGCESAVHVTRSFIDQNFMSDKIILKVDFENAFNSVERDLLLLRVKERTPQMYPFLWQCYSTPTKLFFGDKLIKSAVGLQQGDPAGPMGFSLVLHPTVQKLTSELNIWYLDDGTLGGNAASVLNDFKTLIESCHELGLNINPEKCELFFCGQESPAVIEKFLRLSPGIQVVKDLSLLGAPISNECIETIFMKKFDELTRLLHRLPDLKCHIAYFLMKNCFTIPKLTYLLRTTPSWKVKSLISQMDNSIRNSIQLMMNVNVSEQKWATFSLPSRFGGIGIRSISETMLPAFLSSIHSTFSLIQSMLPNSILDIEDVACYSDARREWVNTYGEEILPVNPMLQRDWDEIHCKNVCDNNIYDNEQDNALNLANTQKESNSWLEALPSSNIGTLLNNNTFRISIALRFGLSLCEPHICVCGERVSAKGTHGLSCIKSAGRQSRHHHLNDIIRRALVSARVPSVLEPVGLVRDDGRRPDGMSIIPWKNGKCVVWDVTCTDTVAPSHLQSSARDPGKVAEQAACKKKAKYQSISKDYVFVPLAFETLGPWCEEAKGFVKEIGKRLFEITGERRSTSFLRQRISICIQKGNAAAVMGTVPHSSPLHEVFYVL